MLRTARHPRIPNPPQACRRPPQLVTPELRLVAIMAKHWFREFARRFGFPNNYTTLDLETSGLSPIAHLICTYGYTVVRDRQPVETKEVVLDWTTHPDIDQLALQDDLHRVQAAMERNGRPFHHSYTYLQQYGIDPIRAIEQLLTLIEAAENNDEILVLHNGWAFDVEFIKAAIHNWLHIQWEFHPGLVYDSGIMEKASQLTSAFSPMPQENESMRDWASRIYAARAAVKWNLDQHCASRYNLLPQVGVMQADMHKAASDSLVIHALVEAHRRLAEGVDLHDGAPDDTTVLFEG